MQRTQTTEDFDWDFYNYTLDLEKEWRNSLPRLTDKELLDIFPEAKIIIPRKIAEWKRIQDEFSDTVKKKLIHIRQQVSDEFSQWFLREIIKITDGKKILKIKRHLERFKRLHIVGKNKNQKPKGWLSEDQIQQALTVPIENLISEPLRKSGKTLVGLCPLHNELHPSFHIYPETNSYWCYGCNKGGNAINFLKQLHDYSFREAVQYLIGL